MSRRRKKKDTISIIGKVLIICLAILIGYFSYTKYGNKVLNQINNTSNQVEKKDNNDNNKKEDIKENKTTTKTENDNKKKEEDESNKKYTYKNQEGEKVTIKADKSVEATGFAGASNHKFFLRGTTLYYKNISSGEEEVIIAYNVKDLYIENKEVTADLDKDGKIVVENNYITYKNK